jgi:hypothetical protein
MNENQAATLVVVFVVVAGALGFIYLRQRPPASTLSSKSYYSEDEGKTWYVDDAKNIPPYEHNGKQAVRVYLYRCNGKVFVGHLEKFEPDAKEMIELKLKAGVPPLEAQIRTIGIDVKRPGEETWFHADTGDMHETMALRDIIDIPRCPDGGKEIPVPVAAEENVPSP